MPHRDHFIHLSCFSLLVPHPFCIILVWMNLIIHLIRHLFMSWIWEKPLLNIEKNKKYLSVLINPYPAKRDCRSFWRRAIPLRIATLGRFGGFPCLAYKYTLKISCNTKQWLYVLFILTNGCNLAKICSKNIWRLHLNHAVTFPSLWMSNLHTKWHMERRVYLIWMEL